MTTITQSDIADITGMDDNASWTFYTKYIRQSDSGTGIITTYKVRKYPVAGVLTVVLDPGPAVVLAPDGKTYPFTVPATASALWPLIQAAVTIPPTTTHQQLLDAVDAWLATHANLVASVAGLTGAVTSAGLKTALGFNVFSTADYAAVSGDDRPRVLAAVNAAVAAMTATGKDQTVLIHAPLTFTTGSTKAALGTTADTGNTSHSNVGVPLPVNLAHTLSIVYAPGAQITLSSSCNNVFYIDKLADYDVFQHVHFYNAWTNGGTSVADEAHALVGNSLNAYPDVPLRYLSFQDIKFFGYTKFRGFNWDPAGASGGQYGISLRGEHNGPLEATQTFSKDIYLEYGDMEGGGGLFHVVSGGSLRYRPGGCNHYHDNIVVDRYRVVMPSVPTAYNNHTHTGIYIAGYGFGDRCYVGPGYVENIGDDAIEIGTMQQVDIVAPRSKNPWYLGVYLRQAHAPIDVESQQITITGLRYEATTALTASTDAVAYPIGILVDDQHITLSSTATGGTTTFTVPGFGTTAAINWNASKATIAAAFVAIGCVGTTVTGAATLNVATPSAPMVAHVARGDSARPITFTSSLTGGALTLSLDPSNASFGNITIKDAVMKIDGLTYSKKHDANTGIFINGLDQAHRKIELNDVTMILSNYTFDGSVDDDISFLSPSAVFKDWGHVVMRDVKVVLAGACNFTTGGHTGFLGEVVVGGNYTRVEIDGFTEDRSGAVNGSVYMVTAGQTGNNTRTLLRRLTPKTLSATSNNFGVGLFGSATVDRFDVYDCDFSQGTQSAAKAIDVALAGSNAAVVRKSRNIFPDYADQGDLTRDPRVFYAKDFGVIADGAQHNNVANLLDCMAAAVAAGASEVVLPAGVIVTSEAVAGATVTAASGHTYTNNGGIPLPVNLPMKIGGHGEGVTTLKLSAGFLRAFDYWYLADGQAYSKIKIRDFTVDRNNLTGAGIAALSAVSGGVTLAGSGAWTTLPGISATTFKNARCVYFPSTNTGTAKGLALAGRVSGSNFQVRNDGSSLTLVTSDQVQGALRDHVIVGTLQFGGTVPNGLNMTIDQCDVENVDTINVATMTAATLTSPIADSTANVFISLGQNPSNPVMTPSVTNCYFRNVRMNGGAGGITVIGSNPCFIDEVWAVDCFHDTGVNVPSNYTSANFHFGSHAWVGRVGLIRCKGRRSGDVAYEINQPWEAFEEDCIWEDSFNGAYRTSFEPPARTIAGPPTTTLNNGGTLTSGATTATMTALPSGVARAGLMRVDSELMWYQTNAAGTGLTLWRGVNGSTAASHTTSAAVTFVESFKTRIHSIRSTIRNSSTLMAIANAGRAFMAFSNSNLPLPNIAIRDPKIDVVGGNLLMGQFIYWEGWQPDIDIQGLKLSQDSLSHVTADGATGSAIGWDWSDGDDLWTNSVPAPFPRIFGRNNDIRVHGILAAGPQYSILWPNRGFALLDFDFTGEAVMANISNGGNLTLVNLTPFSSKFVVAPQSRLGIRARVPDGMTDNNPIPINVGSSSTITFGALLDVDVDAYDMGFGASTGDSHYAPWALDSSVVGKLRFGKIRHARNITANYPSVKKFAVSVSGTYTVQPDDEVLLVDSSGGAVTINLPASTGGPSWIGEPLSRGRQLVIIDAKFSAATNNITIHPVAADKLDNGTAGANVTVSTNGAHKTYVAYAAMPGWVSI